MNENLDFRKGFFLYHGVCDMCASLTDEQFGKAIRALITYQKTGSEPKIENEFVKIAFDFMKVWDGIDRERYEKILEKRRGAGKKGAEKRWENKNVKDAIA